MIQTPTSFPLIDALQRKPVTRTPIWIMRQAGRYLPEYREVRAKAGDFLGLMKNPELACQVTIQPIERFNLDAAILFSDILTIPDAMGLGLYFKTGEGPHFERPVASKASIQALRVPDIAEKLHYVTDTIRLVKPALGGKVPLLGFTGSPWTLATYMVEGGPSKNFSKIKGLMMEQPVSLHHLLQVLTESIIAYLKAQIQAGVDAVMIFDTWGGVLTPEDYQSFSLDYMQQIIAATKQYQIPRILFTKNGGQWLERMALTGCEALGIDWTINIGDARARVGEKVALQGNLDPAILYASPARIREQVAKLLADFGAGSGHVFNLGHGIHPDIQPEHVAVLVDAVHELSEPYHQ